MVHYGNWSSVQRPIVGRPGYVQRTIIAGGRSHSVVYHSYKYHGVTLYSPVPAEVFAPNYYGWLINPWPQPVIYTPAYWGWASEPWYGIYGSSFAPYPRYVSPDQWLTDYVISAGLRQAYDNLQGTGGGDPSASPPEITDDEKKIVNQDVKDELTRERQFAMNPTITEPADNDKDVKNEEAPKKADVPQEAVNVIPEALKDHLFTVYEAPLEVSQTSGQTCTLAEGDMLFRTGDTPNKDNSVDVEVKRSHASASHTELCAPKAHARVQLADLQEMYNHKKDLLAEGEQKQADLMGKKRGLPKGPDPRPTQLARGKADPETAAAVAELKQMLKDADDAEKQVSVAVAPGS
jgi:hypothetical protein